MAPEDTKEPTTEEGTALVEAPPAAAEAPEAPPEPEEVEEEPEADPEPPVAAAPKKKAKPRKRAKKRAAEEEEDASEDLGDAVEVLKGELGELQRRLEERDQSIQALTNQQRERLESERRRLLMDQWGLRDPAYLALAPSIEDADPLTGEGRRKMIEFRNNHRALFSGSPNLPDVPIDEGDKRGKGHGRINKFGDIFKK